MDSPTYFIYSKLTFRVGYRETQGGTSVAMKYLVGFLLIVLLVLHQDYWQWDDASLMFGVLPRTLAYHMGLSIAAAAVWWLAVVFCWPQWQDGEE